MLHTYGQVGEFFISDDMENHPGFCLFLFQNIILVCNTEELAMHCSETWTSPKIIGWVSVE